MSKYEILAKDIVKNVGGKENIISVAHCVTRLRFQLKDESKAQTDVLKDMDGIVTVMQMGGEYQVVIGNHVPDVYRDVCCVSGVNSTPVENKKKISTWQNVISILSYAVMPSINILAASGIMKGLLSLLSMSGILVESNGLYTILSNTANAMFLFLPIYVGYNITEKLGGNKYLGMTIGAALVYPTMQGVDINIFGMVVNATYTSTMLPVLFICLLSVPMEKFLNKYIPDVVKTFVVPAIVLIICVPLGFCLIGPASNALGEGINYIINACYSISPLLASAFIGLIWQPCVMLGGVGSLILMPLLIGLFSGQPQPLIGALMLCSFVQTGAVFAIYFKSKNKKLKNVALPAGISGIMGITEPAIYGVTLPNGKQFLYSCLGASCACAISSLLGLNFYQLAGYGVFGIPGYINPADPKRSLIVCLISIAIATIIGFIIAWFTFKDKQADNEKEEKNIIVNKEVIVSPIVGTIMPLSEVNDKAFSEGLLGNGCAIQPLEGKVIAPCDGIVMALFETKHAVGILSDNGAEILIHIGLDTVKLNGANFKSYVTQGDKITKGQVLIEFDVEAITQAGYSLVTPVIITNSTDYLDIVLMKEGEVKCGEDILTLII